MEDQLRRTTLGFDYIDQLLDIVVTPELTSWNWKDDDELEQAVSLGLISSTRAEEMRLEGEKS